MAGVLDTAVGRPHSQREETEGDSELLCTAVTIIPVSREREPRQHTSQPPTALNSNNLQRF